MVIKRFSASLLVICSIVSLLAVPVFATSSGNATMYYSVLPFDYIGFGTNYRSQDEWMADQMRNGNSFNLDGEFANYHMSCNGSRITNEFVTSVAHRSFMLSMTNKVINVNTLNELSYQVSLGLDGDLAGTCFFQGQVLTYELVGNRYVPMYYRFQGSSSQVDYRFPHVGRDIRDAISSVVSQPIVLVMNLTVEFQCTYDEFDGWYYVDSRAITSLPTSYNWGNQFNMTHETVIQVDPADPSDVSFVDWIGVAVGGFFDFELWPGMTLGEVIEFILVFGMVFWFLTMVI